MMKSGDYSFENLVWEQVSDQGKDFIARLLIVDPDKRMNAEEI